ncbi:MAG: porin, partial [Bacteroidales bacterium]|nr:porin [Bacteroidales bacterium]
IPIAKTWDFVATYDYFNYNKDLAGTETTKYVAGFQYWFYKQCRLQAQYIYTDSNGIIGSYSTVMLQTQFSF